MTIQRNHPPALPRAVHLLLGACLALATLLPSVAHADDDTVDVAALPGSWSLNFTPVLIVPSGNERFGGGADPELKYTADLGRARLSAGARIGAYYARELFGLTFMPTLRLMVPVGRLEPYVAFGLGYGWIPKLDHAAVATMSRVGLVVRLSESFALGVEGTVQRVERSRFAFPSFGSMVSIDL